MKLSKDMIRMMTGNVVSGIVFSYINLFVNLYIWEKNKEIFDIALFNLTQFITWSFFYVLGTKIFSKTSSRTMMALSSICALVSFYILSSITTENNILWIVIVGFIFGIMYGFHYSSYTQSLSFIGKKEEYTYYFSVLSIVTQTISIFLPIIFAVIIKLHGYNVSFYIMIVFSAIMLLSSFIIPNVKISEDKEEIKKLFKDISFKKVFFTKKLKLSAIAMIAGGMFLQFNVVFSLVYVFSITNEKLYIALLSSFYTLLAMASLKIYKKTKEKITENNWLLIGVISIFIGFIVGIVFNNTMLILANVFLTIGMFFFRNIFHGQQYVVAQDLNNIQKSKFFIWREVILCYSRSFMLVFILFIDDIKGIPFILLFIVAIISSMTVVGINRKIEKE